MSLLDFIHKILISVYIQYNLLKKLIIYLSIKIIQNNVHLKCEI